MSNKTAVERSVTSLQTIYAIIIALSMGQAIQTLFEAAPGGPLKLSSDVFTYIPAFITFISLLVPFYHGMNRHLDMCYIEKSTDVVKGALLFDFVIFFVEAALLFAFSASLNVGLKSFIILGILLSVDSAWALISHWIHYRQFSPSIIRWTIINSSTIVLGFVIYKTQLFADESKPTLLVILAVLRTVADYWACWDFYFPETGAKPQGNA